MGNYADYVGRDWWSVASLVAATQLSHTTCHLQGILKGTETSWWLNQPILENIIQNVFIFPK